MPKKEKKKSWKERRRERQIKQQRVQEAYQIQKEKEAERKPRKWPKGKIFVTVFVLVLILGVYGAWQLTQSSTPADETPPPVTPTSGFIYIRPDGQISPSTAPISNDGNNYYTFTADIYNSIIIGKDNIVIDGANHVLQGTRVYDSRGIDLTGRSDVTIKNVKIKGFDYGIYLSSASDNVLSQNDLTDNYCGIWIVVSSNNNIISGNNLVNNEMYAMWLKESSNNKISENKLTSHGNYTIYIRASSGTTISANHIANNKLGIFLYETSNNILYHNNFIDNAYACSIYASTSVWDNGYPSGGNYWSDYGERYTAAKELDGSGIWDTPYVVYENTQDQDNYPLINPRILD